MPTKPTLALIPPSVTGDTTTEARPPVVAADAATALRAQTLIADAATAGEGSFARSTQVLPKFEALVMRYAAQLPASGTDAEKDAVLMRLIRADFPADAYLFTGLKREVDAGGDPEARLEIVMAQVPATGDGRIERRAEKYDLAADAPVPDALTDALAQSFVRDQLQPLYLRAYEAANPVPVATDRDGRPVKANPAPQQELAVPRPAWHIPAAIGGGLLGGVLLTLLVSKMMQKKDE